MTPLKTGDDARLEQLVRLLGEARERFRLTSTQAAAQECEYLFAQIRQIDPSFEVAAKQALMTERTPKGNTMASNDLRREVAALTIQMDHVESAFECDAPPTQAGRRRVGEAIAKAQAAIDELGTVLYEAQNEAPFNE